jgi:hypothetical protein
MRFLPGPKAVCSAKGEVAPPSAANAAEEPSKQNSVKPIWSRKILVSIFLDDLQPQG